ncbi:uncharacterized protein [Apostichopus japonicus]|uniref:uncharacterized protein n=1 Tax=Stichopus japonicus TaxID=307972 RepID=UPI003AB57EA2
MKCLKDYEKLQDICKHDIPLTYFCLSCELKICPECVLSSHNNELCDPVRLSDIPAEILKRSQALIEKAETAKASTTSAERLLVEKHHLLSQFREDSRRKIGKDSSVLIENIERIKGTLLREIDEQEKCDRERMIDERKIIQNLDNEVEKFSKFKQRSAENKLHDLQELKRAMDRIKLIQNSIDQQNETLNEKMNSFLYRRVPNDGTFCVITMTKLVGSLVLYQNQLLHIFDERQSNEVIVIICVNPDDTSCEYWRRLVKTDNVNDPVISMNTSMFFNNKHYALFAVGRKVYVLRPKFVGSLYDSAESVFSVLIDTIPEGSCITHVANHMTYGNKFILSSSQDRSSREYDFSGTALRVIDIKDHVQSHAIFKIAGCNSKFAIISQGVNDAVLINSEKSVKKCGALIRPLESFGMSPVDIVYVDDQWVVLYNKTSEDKGWNVAQFKLDGEFLEYCFKGTSPDAMSVPVSIARWGTTVYVSLANTTVKKFELQ